MHVASIVVSHPPPSTLHLPARALIHWSIDFSLSFLLLALCLLISRFRVGNHQRHRGTVSRQFGLSNTEADRIFSLLELEKTSH